MILRFLALRVESDSYSKPMKAFLNRFMERYRNIDEAAGLAYQTTFASAIGAIVTGIGVRAFKPTKAFNAAVFDSVTVGVSRRLERGPVDNERLRVAYDGLLTSPEYQRATSRATSDEQSVRERLSAAIEAFANI